MSRQTLITLTASPAIEESLVDWLLEIATHSGFTSYPVNGHSSEENGLSLAEQVVGRKKQIRFQIHIPSADLPEFMEKFRADFAGAGIHYWVTGLDDAGHV